MPMSKSTVPVVVAIVGAIASIVVAAITAASQARSETATQISVRRQEVDALQAEFGELKRQTATLQSQLGKLARIDALENCVQGLSLTQGTVVRGPDYAATQSEGFDHPDPGRLMFMIGQKDGTGAGIRSENYYREISLSKPPGCH